jgi:pilus assembly protein CpaB
VRRQVSETLLSDVRVLATDQRAANEKNQVLVPQTTTLEVGPKGA